MRGPRLAAGFADSVKVDGGGLLGVWDDSNWTVCAQIPAAGQPLSGTLELTVDRSCGNGTSPAPAPSDATSATASSSASASPTAEESVTPSPSATPTSARSTHAAKPVVKQPITAANNKDFAAVLADPNGDCDSHTKAFVEQYDYDKIAFTGTVANIQNHPGDTLEKDVLVTYGNAAVSFQFQRVETDPGGPVPPRMGLPSNSAPLAQDDKVQFVAQLDGYNASGCLVELDPVSAKIVD